MIENKVESEMCLVLSKSTVKDFDDLALLYYVLFLFLQTPLPSLVLK